MRHLPALTLAVLVTVPMVASAQRAADGRGPAPSARAELKDAAGSTVGRATFRETGAGVLITLTLDDVQPGVHAMHLHETGACEPPDFESAGGHVAPSGHAHGFMAAGGSHAGDLPNVHVGRDGVLIVEVLAARTSLAADGSGSLFDEDGSAVVLHDGKDDYTSQPAGDAGPPIACGVIER